jgi:tetratricopeptide (TPR) repeat protein
MKLIIAAAALLFTTGAWCAESVDELLRKGDACDQKLQAGEALKYYLPAEKADSDNPRILTRIAREYRHLMADAKSKDEKLRLGKISLVYAQRAAGCGPNDCDAQLSPAISYGKMLPMLPSKEQVEASPRIKAAVDRALALDPRNDTAWHVLGRWNRVLADISPLKRTLASALYGKLPNGSLPEAERCLNKAIAIDPTRLMHYIELGRIYAQEGRKEDARRLINKGLAMPNVEKDDPEMKTLGREALAKL